MAIDNVDTTSVEKASGLLANLLSLVSTFESGLKSMTGGIANFGKTAVISTQDATDAMEEYQGAISLAMNALKKSDTRSFGDLIASTERVTLGVDKLTNAALGLAAAFIPAEIFGDFSVQGESAINTVNTHLAGMSKVLEGLHVPGALITGLSKIADNAAASEKLENSYLAMSAASGELGEMFDATGTQLKNLSSLTTQYTKFAFDAADATGLDGKQVLEWSRSLGTIPGFMKSIVVSGEQAKTQTDGLTTAMKLMSGSGKDMGTVTSELTTAFEDLSQAHGKLTSGESAQKGAEFFAAMSNASVTLQLRFQDVQKLMNDVAGSFKYIGDNTSAATTILGQYSNALQQTGLTSKASTELIGTMIEGIHGLDVAHKAFLSSQSGGPGGLQGAFKIEQMMREGKTDQVMEMAQRAMQKKMGPIVGLKEAAASPEAASQFMKQRMMLQQGIFGVGKGTSDEQATHILEAIKNRDTKSFKELSGAQGLGSVIDKGNAIQANNRDTFKTLVNQGERIAMATEISAGIDRKQMIGNEGAAAGINRQAAEFYNQRAREGAKEFGNRLDNKNARPGVDAMAQMGAAGMATSAAVMKDGWKGFVKDIQTSMINKSTTEDLTTAAANPEAAAHHYMKKGLERSMAAHQQPGAQQMAHPIMREHAAPTPGHATPHGAQNVNLSIKVIAPEGFDVVPSSHSSSVKMQVLNHNNSQTPTMVPRK